MVGRANASYFYIAKEFVRDNIDVDILEELLSLGGLGIQYCIKSELAYSKLHEIKEDVLIVEYSEFNDKYNQRDTDARQRMRDLVDSDVYLSDVVENQGKLFDLVAQRFPDNDTEDFINTYMQSKVRKSIDV
ncbi:MAG: DUF3990 domain-containing protein [Roseburia sp.]|nr:DUF3990 domain-containing protein [Roseburia sp.]